jgi:hypothetical protein
MFQSREAFEAKNSWQTAINPFLDWLTNELYITKTCPSVIEICTKVKQRASDVNLASTLTYNASAINLADFVRFYSIVPNYQVLETVRQEYNAQNGEIFFLDDHKFERQFDCSKVVVH